MVFQEFSFLLIPAFLAVLLFLYIYYLFCQSQFFSNQILQKIQSNIFLLENKKPTVSQKIKWFILSFKEQISIKKPLVFDVEKKMGIDMDTFKLKLLKEIQKNGIPVYSQNSSILSQESFAFSPVSNKNDTCNYS